MHIEKRYAIAFAKRSTFDIEKSTANFAQATDGNVPRNQRIRNALQQAFLKIDIGTTNFREFDLKQSRVLFELRLRNVAEFDGRVGLRDDGDDWHDRMKLKGMEEKWKARPCLSGCAAARCGKPSAYRECYASDSSRLRLGLRRSLKN